MILKNHKISFVAKEMTTPEDILIPIVNDKPYKEIQTSCGCTKVEVTPTHYIVKLDRLPQVKWFTSEETQTYFIKKVNFTIIHEDDTKEKVNIEIAVYDSV